MVICRGPKKAQAEKQELIASGYAEHEVRIVKHPYKRLWAVGTGSSMDTAVYYMDGGQ